MALGMHVVFLAISGILVASGYDLFPTKFDGLPLELHDQPWLGRDYAWREKDKYPNRVDRTLPPDKYPTWDRAFTREGMLLFYDASDDNIFTKDKLQLIQTIEQRVVSVTEFSSYCQVTQSGTCQPPMSVLRFFDGTYISVDPVFNDTNFDNIEDVLYAAYTHSETKGTFLYMLGKNHEIKSSFVSCTLIRTLVPLGWPLHAYSDENAMLSALTNFMADHMKPVLDAYLDVSEFEFSYYNMELMYHDMFQMAMYDMALAAGSLIFIFLFIWFHTGSLWVTSLAVLSIVSSFMETNLIYRVVIGFKYFGFFHIIAMFIILGIGADDLFVFWDAWKATGLKAFPTLAHRLNEAYRKSVISMLVTSFTTMIAFLANALSPLLATRSFGSFAAILVIINYLSVMTFFPCIVIFYHLHFEAKPHPFCCCWGNQGDGNKNEKDVSPTYPAAEPKSISNGHILTVSSSSHEKNTISKFQGGHNRVHPANVTRKDSILKPGTKTSIISQNSETESDKDSVDSKSSEKPSKLVIFFRDYYFALVTHRIVRWVIVVLLLGCVAGLAFSASNLEPDNEEIQLYKDSHHYSKAIRHNNYGFTPNDFDRTITIYLVWGLKENDLSECHFSSIDCQGSHSFDDSFDASTVAAQQAFVSFCETLLNFTETQASEYAIKRDLKSGQLEIACFPRNMETFLKDDPVSGSVDVSMPWNWTEISDFMTSLNNHYNTSVFNSNFSQYLDIPLTYWIWDGFQQNNTEDYQIFNSLFGEETDTFSSSILTAPSVTTGNRIKYMAIAVNTTLKTQSLGYTEGIPIVERWEQFMEQQMEKMPVEMKGGFQTTIRAWHWLYVQRSLAENAILGIALGVSLALPVLIVATCNVFNGLMATLAICSATVCVIGVIPLGGWKLGVLVSLNMCLVVGLAVDFVVHLAEGYHMAHATDRKGRLQEALRRVGISVFSGACTTLGASFFMLFAKIQFFFQFGLFIFSTIAFSLLFSMGFYVTVMGILGPQGNIGDIRVFFKKCCARIRPGKNEISHLES